MCKCMMAATVALTLASAFAKVEIVQNGSLEKAEGGMPVGWENVGEYLSEGGNHFLRLEQKKPGEMVSVYRRCDVPAGAKRAVMSFRGRVFGLVVGENPWYDARVIVNFKDKDGKGLKGESVYFNGDTVGWEQRSAAWDIPEGTAYVEYMPSLFNCKAGRFDFDDLSFVLTEDGKAADKDEAKPKLPECPLCPLTAKDELRVKGNRLVNAAGQEVWLQGVAIPSLEWMVDGDHVRESTAWAVADWQAKVIRLAVHEDFWFGRAEKEFNRRNDGGAAYRKTVDEIVDYANARGTYVVIDLHEYKAPTVAHARFWADCAKRYANRPGVLFDLLNEPHGISWREWRDGGELKDGSSGSNPDENDEAKDVKSSIGMQKLVETVRATGAKNVVICGGLDWAYDCSGVTNGYELKDPSGHGIVYSVHVYPWKANWQKCFLDCAAKHPLFLGEVGCQDFKMPFETELKDPYAWATDILALIQQHRLNWTAWSFHPSASPCVISGWDYKPTACWGAFVRAALRGSRFGLSRLR